MKIVKRSLILFKLTNMLIGIAIVIIGLVLLMQALGLITGNIWSVVWPSLLIILGVGIICKEQGKCCCKESDKKEEK